MACPQLIERPAPRRTPKARLRSFVLIAPLTLAMLAQIVSCGVRSKRSASGPVREATYDDACNLQAYFDERIAAALTPPIAVEESIVTSGKGHTMGEGRYALKDPMIRRRFAKMLREEFTGIEDKMLRAADGDGSIVLYVRWYDTGAMRRMRPDEPTKLETSMGAVELPANGCVTDLLFGEKIYAMRAKFLRSEVALATGKLPDPTPESFDSGVTSTTSSTSSTSSTPPSAPPIPSGTASK